MSEPSRRLRVLHLVSAQGQTVSMANSMLTQLLVRADRQRFEMQAVHFLPGEMLAAVLRQAGVSVHEVELSRKRFSLRALVEINSHIRAFKPDVIHAWGHTAQCVTVLLRRLIAKKVAIVWSMPAHLSLQGDKSFIARQKLKLCRKSATTAQRIIYASTALAAFYKRLGFPERLSRVLPLGLDVDRYKPDPIARQRVREQLKLDPKAFVIGMNAPFVPEHDFPTFIKATGEMIKLHSNIEVIIAGRGAQRGHAGLMALLGGGTLASRTELLGEWTDLAALFNACDVVCSCALDDSSALTIAMAMLCGVPCVATGKGAQGEVLGQYGVVIDPGSVNGIIRGVTRILEMNHERRAFMSTTARTHVLQNFSVNSSVEKHLDIYGELTGTASVSSTVATPAVS